MRAIVKRITELVPGSDGIINFLRSLFLLPEFFLNWREFRASEQRTQKRFNWSFKDAHLRLFDSTTTTQFDPHYVYHPAWAARILAANKPTKHIDIASILAFPTIVSAFIPVEYYDFRPANLRLSGLTSSPGTLLALPFLNNSVESISCMHTVEHVGLGRYGDEVDYDADLKAMRELVRVLAPGGTLLFVAPVGKPRIQFNAHRIYSHEQIVAGFSGLTLKEFSMVPDDFNTFGLITHADPTSVPHQTYACGCFWFIKEPSSSTV